MNAMDLCYFFYDLTPCGHSTILLYVLQMKTLIKSFKKTENITAFDRFLAGSSAGAISQTVIYPMEVSYKIL